MTIVTPTLTAEIAFTTDPWSTPTWVDVTDDVRAVKTGRGKARVLDNMPAGSGTVVLDNSSGDYDPNNTSGAHSPDVKPYRRIRFRASVGGTTNGIFHGFVTGWPQTGIHYPGTSLVPVSFVDGFEILNLRRIDGTYSQEASGTRIGNVLDDVGWPAGDRDIDTGQTTVQNVTLDDGNPLDHILTVAKSENGLVYVDVDGQLRFIDRLGLFALTLDAGTHTFGDDTGEIAYAAVDPVDFDDLDIWNDIRVSSQGVATQTATDATSQSDYLTRTLERTGLFITSTNEQSDHAEYLLVGFKDPVQRIDRLVHDDVHTAVEWQAIFDRDLGSKVLVKAQPAHGGTTISQRSSVEGIGWNITVGREGERWQCVWNLQPMTRRFDFWILGDAIQSLLGDTTRLGYAVAWLVGAGTALAGALASAGAAMPVAPL